MTNLQVVKALEAQVEASFKRSATNQEEAVLRDNIRAVQDVFRKAHAAGVKNATVSRMTERNLANVSPAMSRSLRQMLERQDGGPR